MTLNPTLGRALVAASVLLLSTTGRSPEASDSAEADGIAEGKRVFTENCAPCHGPGARGDGPLAPSFDPPPQDLVSAGIHVSIRGLHVVVSLPHYSTRLLRERARDGNDAMPAWKDILTPAEIDAVVLYIRSLMEEQGP